MTMLVVNTSGLETPHRVEISQDDIDYDIIIKCILEIIDSYKDDKRYTKKMCRNHIGLTLFGLIKFAPEKYVKLPIITVDTTNHIIRGILFKVDKYLYVEPHTYLIEATKCFKASISDTIAALADVSDTACCRHEFKYLRKRLSTLLDNNVRLESDTKNTKEKHDS